jgi:DUF971 family protein
MICIPMDPWTDSDVIQIPASPPIDPEAIPEEAVLTRDKRSLRLTWHDGTQAVLSAATLRLRCRCGWCTRDRLQDRFPAVDEDITLTRIEPMGGFAVHLAFSDDHARGIFPWVYLRDLAREAVGSAVEPACAA